MKVSELLQAMIDAGAPLEAAMIALRAIEEKDAEIASRDALIDARRLKDAERKRISRLSTDCPRTVHGRGVDTNEPDKNPPQTPHKNSYTPVTPKGVTAPNGAVRNRGSKIDPDWSPPAIADLPPQAKSLASLWTDASYRTEAEAFVNFWTSETGTRAAKADWGRAWANRIVQIHSKVMRDQKFGNAAPDAPPQKDRATMIAETEDRARKFRELGRADDAERAEKFLIYLKNKGPPFAAQPA